VAPYMPFFWGSPLYVFVGRSPSVFAPHDVCVAATPWSAPALPLLAVSYGVS
jgi:hypothetical protein